MQHRGLILTLVALVCGAGLCSLQAADKEQYKFGRIAIPAATAKEPVRKEFSLPLASKYLDDGSTAWSRSRACVACHTNGTYMVTRPALSTVLGNPQEDHRGFFVRQLEKYQKATPASRKSGITPTAIAYIAQGLAEWDLHVTKKRSPQTDEALKLMFEVQGDKGDWGNVTCWPPHESDNYHSTTVAAMAIATAPGWLADLKDDKQKAGVEKIRQYLRTTKPPHDYSRILLLWTATRWKDLLDDKQKQELVEAVWKHQRPDGGWSIRTFAKPEAWGGGNRAAKLKSEPEFKTLPSDGHQTGLAVLVLRDAGVPASDPRLKKAVAWLLANQRESGRWWTRSLNTDSFHFITYSGTAYPLMALEKCGAIPAPGKKVTSLGPVK